MSINDLLDSEIFIPAMLVVFVVIMLFAIPAGIAKGKRTNDNIYGDSDFGEIKEEKCAKIIARRTNPHPLNQTAMVNTVVFELVNGERLELAIKDSNAYGVMVEGDLGTLKYQGKKFVDFQRDNGSET